MSASVPATTPVCMHHHVGWINTAPAEMRIASCGNTTHLERDLRLLDESLLRSANRVARFVNRLQSFAGHPPLYPPAIPDVMALPVRSMRDLP
jgi:hypothetical protein